MSKTHAAFWIADARWTLSAALHALADHLPEPPADLREDTPEDDDPYLFDHSLIDDLDDAERVAFAARTVRQVQRSLEEACDGTDLLLPLFTPPGDR